jgi:hypothetical protein
MFFIVFSVEGGINSWGIDKQYALVGVFNEYFVYRYNFFIIDKFVIIFCLFFLD